MKRSAVETDECGSNRDHLQSMTGPGVREREWWILQYCSSFSSNNCNIVQVLVPSSVDLVAITILQWRGQRWERKEGKLEHQLCSFFFSSSSSATIHQIQEYSSKHTVPWSPPPHLQPFIIRSSSRSKNTVPRIHCWYYWSKNTVPWSPTPLQPLTRFKNTLLRAHCK